MKIQPVNKYLIAQLYKEPEEATTRLILTTKDPVKDRFIVTDVPTNNEQGICVGDIILCDPYGARPKEIGSDVFYIIEIDRVIGVIKP